MAILCLVQIDPDTQEATGVVAPFCSEKCRQEAKSSLNYADHTDGESGEADFGFTPQCEKCGAEVADSATEVAKAELKAKIVSGPATSGEFDGHDWAIGVSCEDGILAFVDGRPLSYKKTPEDAKAYALEIIVRLQADGDYRLNDRPAGFMPPPQR